MKQHRKAARGRLLASTLFMSSTLLASPAFAQDMQGAQSNPEADTAQTTAAEETGGEEAIVITGSLIRNPNLVSSSPVNVVGEEEIELQQANVAEELLRELPGATPSIGSAVNNGNGGSSFVDLRGLGPGRNIALVDGVRLVPSNLGGVFDLNNIPLALIQRVDVLTGGASTTYGADAVSGVVNFITRQDFAGVDINLSEQITEQGDGNVFRADVTIGANFDDGRGNAVLSVGYQEADAVYQGARDISIVQFDSFTGAGGGSGTSVPSTFSGVNINGVDSVTQNCGTGFPVACNAVQGNRQVNGAGGFNTPAVPFNFNPYNVFQTPFQRFNIYGAARYEISDAIELYTRGVFSKNTVNTLIAPSGAFGLGVAIPLNNPLLPASLRNGFCRFDTNTGVGYTPRFSQAVCDAAATATGPTDPNYREVNVNISRRAVEVGPRNSEFTTNFFDYRVGARGGITDSINWDVFASYGESEVLQVIKGFTLNSRVQQSLRTTGSGATLACRDTSNGCTPINWFGPLGSITPGQVDFLQENSTVRVSVSLAQARAVINGDFGWTLPWAGDAVSFAVGAEFREYAAQQASDALAQSGDLGGSGGPAPGIDGGFNVYEAFGELIIPIAQDRPFFDELTLEGGARYSSYSVDAPNSPSYSTWTWKVGGTWAPVDGLRFRGNYSRSVRAPSIFELFNPVSTGLTNLANDPCANIQDNGLPVPGRPAPSGELLAICLAQGAPAGVIGSIPQPTAGQANSTGGGSLDLEPETSTSWTVGAVFQPSFVPGLSLSVDYYSIRIKDAITAPTPADSIFACFGPTPLTPAAGSSLTEACRIIRRNPNTGSLAGDPTTTPGLFATLTNQGRLSTSGVDFTANYRRNLEILGGVGLDMNFVLSWVESFKFQAVAGETIDRQCAGLYSPNCSFNGIAANGSILPKWQWTMRTTLTFGDIDVSLLWRHIDRVEYEFADTAPAFRGTVPGFGDVDFNRIPAYDYFDLTTRFAINDNLSLVFSVQNLFDKAPPLVGNTIGTTSFNSGNTYPSTYDALGRRFVASARIRF
jgi:outer membrane receptor protein involved in Fe transport